MRFLSFVKVVCPAIICCFLASCQTTNDPYVWVRADGKRMANNPALQKQGQLDLAICQGEAGKSNAAMPIVVGQPNIYSMGVASGQRNAALNSIVIGCMAQRGYLHLPQSQAARVASR